MANATDLQSEVTALTMLNSQEAMEKAALKRENSLLKKATPALGQIGIGGVSVVTGAIIGGAQGYQTGGDPAAELAIKNVGPGIALVGGVAGAVALRGNPKAQAASVAVATAGGVLLAHNLAHDEGVKMKLDALKTSSAAAAKAALPAGTPPAAPAPAVGGWRKA